MVKTIAIKMLDNLKKFYNVYEYETPKGQPIDGITLANLIEKDCSMVFKTLVTVGKSCEYYVFVIPVACELHLKNAARLVGEKSIEMIPVKNITAVTSYVKGGVSPIGMKKKYKTIIDASAQNYENIFVSGGKIGLELEIHTLDLAEITSASFGEVAH